ncbi:hypothetical protein FA15DRAFT_660972 [Coprinopsis marcescibilis]|uniref:Uncharacterized protein n=1 Tax=Coprinopsis marcescibilis TaxID=230819 RepID=A0A5C3KDN4_COPMA|nr:hypothetical protein FA15DRAFT_660972 [Coprinopsis marcescibilis]
MSLAYQWKEENEVVLYVQKDKRKSLQPHMEKCIFIGYPAASLGMLQWANTAPGSILMEKSSAASRSMAKLTLLDAWESSWTFLRRTLEYSPSKPPLRELDDFVGSPELGDRVGWGSPVRPDGLSVAAACFSAVCCLLGGLTEGLVAAQSLSMHRLSHTLGFEDEGSQSPV